ncbi:Coenzyme A biosynthesis bifunctional protein CoaBC [Streptomyces griseoloalbus]
MWDDVHEVPHVRIGQGADLVVVAPATADMLAKAAHGLADDLLTNTLLTARCPVVFAPAMHTEMWEHPATQENVATLRRRGAVVIEPAVGRLTGVDNTGKGRLPDPGEIFEVCRRVLARGVTAPDLAGRHVVISAGGTREPLDPVRYLGNRSSGKQGYALARTAVARGARVTLIQANTGLPDPAGADVVRVGTAVQLRGAQGGRRRGRRGDGGGGGRLPARRVRPGQDQEEGRRGGRPSSPWSATPTSSPRSPPSVPGLELVVGFAAETLTMSSPTAGPSSAARAAICSWSTRWGSARPSAPRRTRRSSSPRTERRPRCRTDPRKRLPTRSGIWFREGSRRCDNQPSWASQQRVHNGMEQPP